MAGIYGKIKEHPEYPIWDDRRFTIEIKQHKFEGTLRFYYMRLCGLCGYEESHQIHQILLRKANESL